MKNEAEWIETARIQRTEFLAAGESREAIFWPTPGFKDWPFDGSAFSAEGPYFLRTQFPITGVTA